MGTDIATVQFRWPVGMPTCRPGVKARNFGGEELSDPKPDCPRPVLGTSRTDATAWVDQEDKTQQTPENDLDSRCEAAEGG